jgi:cytochrome c biogenesis protein CcmG/thiol:disulfide interchange protein DsbE
VKRVLIFAPVGVLLALVVLFVGYALRHDPHVYPAALVGKAAPVAPLQPLDGGGPPQPPTLAVKGPILVNFFQSTCAPCVVEAPALMALKSEGVPIVGVAWKDQDDGTRGFLKTYGDPFRTVLADHSGRAGVEWGVSGVPETFAIDASGRITAKRSGALTPQDAEALAESLGR